MADIPMMKGSERNGQRAPAIWTLEVCLPSVNSKLAALDDLMSHEMKPQTNSKDRCTCTAHVPHMYRSRNVSDSTLDSVT